jgi:predicted TIM-barrel fold metal-dependent hydrolase
MTDLTRRTHHAGFRMPSRREFLTSLAAAGAAAIATRDAFAAQPPGGTTAALDRIDVHHHMMPPAYREVAGARIAEIASDPSVLQWTPARAIEQMDRYGVATSMLSLPVPGAWFQGPETSRRLARVSNDFGARTAADSRGRFGLLASLPLPDVAGSLAEIAYAFDVLHADGIALQTSYDDRFPGDAAFAPVFDELNRRKAVIFVHPTEPACCASLIPGVKANVAEFLFDTTRAILSFLANGTFSRHRDIRFVFCHAGGTMPVLAARINGYFHAQPGLNPMNPDGVTAELKRLYYDIANATNPSSMAAILNLVPTSQLVWGSDWPYRPIALTADGWEKYPIAPEVRRAIDRENALRLFPRFGRP